MRGDATGHLVAVARVVEAVETTAVEGEVEGSGVQLFVQEVEDAKVDVDSARPGLGPGLLDRQGRELTGHDRKALLREPDCVVPSTAADLQRPAR